MEDTAIGKTPLMSRDYIYHRVRTALGRNVGQPPEELPPPRIRVPEMTLDEKLERFRTAIEALGGEFHLAASNQEARTLAAGLTNGKTAVASHSAFLEECGILTLENVCRAPDTHEEVKAASAAADVGITSADFALADTGTLVLLTSPEESRLVSVLPAAHLAIVPVARLLSGLDELFVNVPLPVGQSSAMVLITGPSRTADIEQILVRGVHGPGEVHVVFVRG